MSEIVPGLHWVEEIRSTVNVYVWDAGNGLTLIDCGMPWHAKKILAFVQSLEHQPGDVRRILVTHGDIDHVGALAALKAATGAMVICHAAEKGLIEGADRRRLARSPLGVLLTPIHPLITRVLGYKPARVDEVVIDGHVLIEGFRVVHAPGHTPGQMTLYHPERRLLFTGDALVNFGGRLGTSVGLFTPQPDIALKSIRRLAKLDVEVACFGHGPPIIGGAGDRIRELANRMSS
ncbi:MAG TPA: MBL fold metallo-hydrolase [Anaerolineae bacterium]|nr:MBL fold metallo-hydrolase [Anaerolineae bacterium]